MIKIKYIPYVIIAVLIVIAMVFISGKLNVNNTSQTKEDDKSSTQSAIDDELNQIDKELSGMKDSNFDASGLSDDELGL